MHRRLIATLVALLALAGCSAQPAPTVESSPPSGPPPATTPSPEQASGAASPSTLPVLASRETTAREAPITIAVNSLHTGTAGTTLNFTVTNHAGEDLRLSTALGPDDHRRNVNVSAVSLVDLTTGKRYLPARDRDDNCVCSSTHTPIGAGQSVAYSAVFAPLAESADTISVYIPLAGTFDEIPVTR